MEENKMESGSNFIHDFIDGDLKDGVYDHVQTRFPPEPNGYLHIGHAKAICINFATALKYGGKCNLRLDDTNPTKEDTEYVDAILEDIKWLGFQWDHLYYASDYFDFIYECAVRLIELGKAYVDDLTADEIRAYRGTLTEPGKESPYRNRSVEENLDLFRRMTAGEFQNGTRVLRAKSIWALRISICAIRSSTALRTSPITARATSGASTRCTILRIHSPMQRRASRIPYALLNLKTTARFTIGSCRSWASSIRRARSNLRA